MRSPWIDAFCRSDPQVRRVASLCRAGLQVRLLAGLKPRPTYEGESDFAGASVNV